MASEKWNLATRKLKQIQRLPLECREEQAILKIKNAFWDLGITPSETYIAYSGGKESIVLSHLAWRALDFNISLDKVTGKYKIDGEPSRWPDFHRVTHLFENTTLEHLSILPFVKNYFKQVKGAIVYPLKRPIDVWKSEGFPFLGKRIADHLTRLRRGNKSNWFVNNYGKYLPLVKIDTRISDKCCYYLKKGPAEKWATEHNMRLVMLGTRADESRARKQDWVERRCLHQPPSGIAQLKPLSYFSEQDIWDYIRKYNLPYPRLYDEGYKRTGCMVCGFGSHIESPNKFEILRKENYRFYLNVMLKLGYADAIWEINETMGYELIKGGLYKFGEETKWFQPRMLA